MSNIRFYNYRRSVEFKFYISCYNNNEYWRRYFIRNNRNKKQLNCVYSRLCVKLIITQKIHSKFKKKFVKLYQLI